MPCCQALRSDFFEFWADILKTFTSGVEVDGESTQATTGWLEVGVPVTGPQKGSLALALARDQALGGALCFIASVHHAHADLKKSDGLLDRHS